MKYIALVLFTAIFPCRLFAAHHNFSGSYDVVSCTPDCANTIVSSDIPFENITNFKLTVRTDEYRTCDKSASSFELNMTFGHYYKYWYNNYSGGNQYAVCDGTFSASDELVSFKTPENISVNLSKDADGFLILDWTELRFQNKIKLQMRLQRIAD